MYKDLQALKCRPKCKDWGNLVQRLCEGTWEMLAKDGELGIRDAAAFTQFLQTDSDAFALARLMIPQLRSRRPTGTDHGDLSIQQESLLASLEEARGLANRTRDTPQESFDHPLYRAEKDILQDAQLHRVRLLLQHTTRFNDVSEEEIAAWLDKAPVR